MAAAATQASWTKPARQHSPAEDLRRAQVPGASREESCDQHEIEQSGREGGRGKAMAGLQEAREQGGEGDQQQIGEGDPGEVDRKQVLQGVGREAGG